MTKVHVATFVILAASAILSFAYAVAILGFQLAFKSKRAQIVNAAILACLWAVGPPIWFGAERAVWEVPENAKELERGQEHAKDLWIGLGAIVLVLAEKRFE